MSMLAISILLSVALFANAAHFHDGTRAAHVTRLHRYDHSGLSAMLEAEAQWHNDGDGLGGAAVVGLRSTSFLERKAQEPSIQRFVQLSRRQSDALNEHHLAVAASAKLRTAHRHTNDVHVTQHAAQSNGDNFAVIGMTSLDSQYVGPIGVGTVIKPSGCAADKGRSLLYMPPEEVANQGTSALQGQSTSCHAEDQSQVWVVFDTGSTNIWVASDLCTTGACTQSGRRKYDHIKSESYQVPASQLQLQIQFGTGSLAGPQAIEDFHVGPFTVYNQTFGMIQREDGKVFDEVPFEGILGLAFPAMSANGVTPFFDNVVHQRALKRSEFGFYFSRDSRTANAAFWGGVDPAFHTGPIEYFNVTDPYYWSLKLLSFKIGNDTLLGEGAPAASFLEDSDGSRSRSLQAIVDTGTTFFTAEDGVYQEVMNRIASKPCKDLTDQSHPPITYRLQSSSGEPRDFVLHNTQYMAESSNGNCAPAFMKIDIPRQHGPAMILGEVFLRQYFSVFDRSEGTNGAVGFAVAAHGKDLEAHLKNLTRHQPAFKASQPSKPAPAGRHGPHEGSRNV